MTISQLKEELARKMQDVQSHKLWQTAYQIAKDFGIKETRTSSDSTTESFDLKIKIGDTHFEVSITPYHYGHLHIFIVVNGETVFSASEVESASKLMLCSESIQFLCSMIVDREYRLYDNTRVHVDRYVAGEWLQSFEYSIFEEAVNALNAEKTAREAEAKRVEEQERQLTKEENEFAVRFGIQTNVRVSPNRVHSVR